MSGAKDTRGVKTSHQSSSAGGERSERAARSRAQVRETCDVSLPDVKQNQSTSSSSFPLKVITSNYIELPICVLFMNELPT